MSKCSMNLVVVVGFTRLEYLEAENFDSTQPEQCIRVPTKELLVSKVYSSQFQTGNELL